MTGTTFLPLKVGSSIVWASAKSFSQPTLGQTATLAFGTPQNFEYIVLRVTAWKLTLKPSFSRPDSATSATRFWAGALSATISSFWPPVNLPLL